MHHRFLAWLGRLTNTVILCPHPVSIGNASEDYHFGLLKARREGKKLVVLFPYPLPGRLRQPTFDPAILLLESEYLALKFGSPVSRLLNAVFTLYFFVVIVGIKLALKFCRFEPPGYYFRPLAGQDIIWRPDPAVLKFDWDAARRQRWKEQFAHPVALSLPEHCIASCKAVRERMGLPHDAWFVCLHVREGGYKKDWNNIRNADIKRYFGAIKEITQRGGWVIRMGDPSMTKLPEMECVIDYAHSDFRSALMDTYLLHQCKFYIGTSSGITDTALLLDKPLVLTNMQSWINLLPPRRGDFLIFKHVFSRSENKFLSLREWLQRATMITPEHISAPDWDLVENSAEEIADAVKEKLDLRVGRKPVQLQDEFKKLHLEAAQDLSKVFRFGLTDLENCNDWHRMASRLLTWDGEISTKFLENNWLVSVKNASK